MYGLKACVNICFEAIYHYLSSDLYKLYSPDAELVASYQRIVEMGIVLHQAYCSVQPTMAFHQDKDVMTIFRFNFYKELVPIAIVSAAGKYNRGDSFTYSNVLAQATVRFTDVPANFIALASLTDAENFLRIKEFIFQDQYYVYDPTNLRCSYAIRCGRPGHSFIILRAGVDWFLFDSLGDYVEPWAHIVHFHGGEDESLRSLLEYFRNNGYCTPVNPLKCEVYAKLG